MVLLANLLRSLGLIVGFLAFSVCAAQQSCPPPQIPTPDPRADVFNDQQETDLGDAIAAQIQRLFLVIDDEDLTGYVQKVGQKLLAQAPPMGMKVQIVLADFAQANALTLPGGRVYVSRKLVAMARSEDELAGVIGHELGHVLTRQPAEHYTQLLKNVLGVTQAGTREEIFRNFESLEENVVRKHKAFERSQGEGKEEQSIADQVGIQLVSRAGYSPKAYADFFDRVTENKGKRGNWLSDVFGATKPDSKRFREMLRQTPALAAVCASRTIAADPAEFSKWQTTVVNYVGLGHKERLHGVLGRTKLDPPLQSDIRQIRFSPDGKYVLAQDDATIYVMTREPFAPQFTIYAPEANPANFTRDSESVVFYTDRLRVESWSVEDRARTSANELTVTQGCRQTALSPDGDYLACYGNEFDLSLYEVSSGTQVFQKKNFYQPRTFREVLMVYLAMLLGDFKLKLVEIHFSPDGKYFVAGALDSTLAVDLDSMQVVNLPGHVKSLLYHDFAFVGPDKILGVDIYNAKNSALVKFPSGELIKKVGLGDQRLEPSTNEHYVLLKPVKDHPIGVLELETDKIVLATDKAALDVFGDKLVRERTDGDIAMLSFTEKKQLSQVKLPQGQLGHLRAFAVSPDLHWMAISEKSRGGEWNLLQGKRVFYVRGFNSAAISAEGVVDADFPEYQQTKRGIAHLDPAQGRIDNQVEIGEQKITQFGSVLLRTVHKGKDEWQARNLELAGLDVNNNVLWSHSYAKEAPSVLSRRSEGNLVFSWPANSEGAKLELKNNEDLAKRWPRADASGEDYLLEAVEPRTGKIAGGAMVRTNKGAFRVMEAETSGSWLVVSDSSNRILVYSVKTGEQKGILFGRRPVISADGSLLAVENERGEMSLYDLKTLERRQQYVFTSPIVYSYFAQDNRRLFVLTGNQTAYFLQLPQAETTEAKQ